MQNLNKFPNTEEIERVIQELQKLIEINDDKYNKEIKNLNREVNRLQHKVRRLETINSSLVKEKNFQLVHEHGAKLLELMEKNNIEEFKKILSDHDYPVDEYLPEKSSYNHLNLLHYSIEFGHFDITQFLIEHGADVNIPEKKVECYLYIV